MYCQEVHVYCIYRLICNCPRHVRSDGCKRDWEGLFGDNCGPTDSHHNVSDSIHCYGKTLPWPWTFTLCCNNQRTTHKIVSVLDNKMKRVGLCNLPTVTTHRRHCRYYYYDHIYKRPWQLQCSGRMYGTMPNRIC